jgi:proteasome accessory factor A
MRRILAGLDTEYGFSVEGRGAEDQLEDAKALVRSYPGERFPIWDDRFESPRNDLRGFRLDRLSFDPDDARFDAGRAPVPDVRSDQVLQNGARFYNDHGHPEYATPETWSIAEAVLHDKAGDSAVAAAAESFGATRVYKNNTDFHGASYGTHESYLVPRSVGVEALVVGLMPLFVARQVLCGAGKVGAEQGARCDFQMSQRADFFSDLVSAETLYRRPIFNTRDEPHADPTKWIRLHVICGESNMSPTATGMKLALVKAALHLIEAGAQPVWRLADPLRAIKAVSRDVDGEGRIDLEGASWTTPRQLLESYAEGYLKLGGDEELESWMELALTLLDARTSDPDRFSRSVDWAAKRQVLALAAEDGVAWSDPYMQALDLEYHRIDDRQGLAFALQEMGALDPDPDASLVAERSTRVFEDTRARARSIAVGKFRERLLAVSWGSLTFSTSKGEQTVLLPPDREYPATLEQCDTVEAFIMETQS